MKKVDRIIKYLEKQGVSLSKFEGKAKLGSSYLSKTRERGAEITQKVLDKILKNAPDDYYKIFPEDVDTTNKPTSEDPQTDYSVKEFASPELVKLKTENEVLKKSLYDIMELSKRFTEVIDRHASLFEKQLTTINKQADTINDLTTSFRRSEQHSG